MFSSIVVKDSLPHPEYLTAAIRGIQQCSTKDYHQTEHDEWYRKVHQSKISMTVTEPETRGSYLKKYIVYLVRQEPDNYKVRRRFSDFEWLHDTLSNRYIGMVIPPLPEKGVYKTDAYIRSRMRGLNLFLQYVLQIPYLISDASLLAFISVQDDREWEAAKKHTAIMDNAGEGHLRWLHANNNFTLPNNADRILLDVKRQLEPLEKHLQSIAASTKRLAEKNAAAAKEMIELKNEFQNWKMHEFNCMDSNKVEYVIPDTSRLDFHKLSEDSSAMMTAWNEVGQFQPLIHEFILHENFKFLSHYIRDLRELLKLHENCLTQFDKAESVLKGHEVDRNNAVNRSSNSTKVGKLDAQITEDKAHLHRIKFYSDFIFRAIFFSELSIFKEIRSLVLYETMGQLAAAEFQFAKRIGTLWQGYIKASQMDSKNLMQQAKGILDSASTPPDPTMEN